MNYRQAYLGMINAFPGGWDAMAAACGMSKDALENRIYERRGQAVTVHLGKQMQEFSGTTFFAEAVAADSAGVFTKLMLGGPVDREDLHLKFQELYSELGRLSTAYTEYTEDNNINKRERVKLEAISDEIHQTMQELMTLMFAIFCKDEAKKSGARTA